MKYTEVAAHLQCKSPILRRDIHAPRLFVSNQSFTMDHAHPFARPSHPLPQQTCFSRLSYQSQVGCLYSPRCYTHLSAFLRNHTGFGVFGKNCAKSRSLENTVKTDTPEDVCNNEASTHPLQNAELFLHAALAGKNYDSLEFLIVYTYTRRKR